MSKERNQKVSLSAGMYQLLRYMLPSLTRFDLTELAAPQTGSSKSDSDVEVDHAVVGPAPSTSEVRLDAKGKKTKCKSLLIYPTHCARRFPH
jgi:hypothetical protein